MSQAAIFETIAVESQPAAWRPRARGNVLIASLAAAFVTTCVSGAAVTYALTHVPEVDPNAEAAPLMAVADIAAQAPRVPTKLEVLTRPVYGPEIVSEAPAAPVVRLSARVNADPYTLAALEQGGDATRPCDDPCSAEAGYVAPDDTQATPATMTPVGVAPRTVTPRTVTPRLVGSDKAQADSDDADDGNAPPPPDMVVN